MFTRVTEGSVVPIFTTLLKMEAVLFSETLLTTYTAHSHVPNVRPRGTVTRAAGGIMFGMT